MEVALSVFNVLFQVLGGFYIPRSIFCSGGYFTQYKYFEIEADATSVYLRSSADGCTWDTNAEVLKSSYIVAIDRVGLFASSENSNTVTGIFDWFRRIY